MKKIKVGELDIYDKDNFYNNGLSVLVDYEANLCDWGIGAKEPKNIFEVLEHWKKYNGNLKDKDTNEVYNLLLKFCNRKVECWEEEDDE